MANKMRRRETVREEEQNFHRSGCVGVSVQIIAFRKQNGTVFERLESARKQSFLSQSSSKHPWQFKERYLVKMGLKGESSKPGLRMPNKDEFE